MNFFCLPNLVSTTIDNRDPLTPRNEQVNIPSKQFFRSWCNKEDLDHCFYSLVEGVGPDRRVRKTNPPAKIHGLVVDYDADPGDIDVAKRIAKYLPEDLRPRYYHRTISGYARLIFEFDKPLLFQPKRIMEKFLSTLKTKLRLNSLLPGLDLTALKNWHQYYEQGHSWEELSKNKISSDYLLTWVEDSSKTHKWGDEDVAIPMDIIRKKGKDAFPDALDWDNVEEGFRCSRFWAEGADAQSVIFQASGCQCFTGDIAFMSWSMIFGHSFVNQFRDVQISKAIEGMHYDGKVFWRKRTGAGWSSDSRADIEAELSVNHGLSRERRQGAPSELDAAFAMINNQQRVVGTFPFLYIKDDIVGVDGGNWINSPEVSVVEPVEEEVTWGEHFPFLSQFFASIFDPYNQREFFLSWLYQFYSSAWEGNVKRGLTLVIAGPTNSGKNFMTDAILGQLMGGSTSAVNHLIYAEPYNANLFSSPVWTAHDAIAPTDAKSHSKFTQLVKKITANDSLEFRPMFREAVSRDWRGRAVITLNDDPTSLSLLPQTDLSVLDKIALLKVQRPQIEKFPSDAEILAELPYFAKYLLQHGIHEDHKGGQRFGVEPYHHAELLEAARSSSPTAIFEESLYSWREDITQEWEGNATELRTSMEHTSGNSSISTWDTFSTVMLGRHMNQLVREGRDYLTTKTLHGNRRVYCIKPAPKAE